MTDNTPKPGDPWVMLMSRLTTLEGIVSGLLSMYLGASQNDPALAKALFQKIKDDIELALQQMPTVVQQEARVYRDALLHRAESEVVGLRDPNKIGPH